MAKGIFHEIVDILPGLEYNNVGKLDFIIGDDDDAGGIKTKVPSDDSQ